MVLLGWESRGKGRPWKPLPFPDTQLGRVPYAMLSKFTHSDKTSTQDAGHLFPEVRLSGDPVVLP